MAWDTLVYTRYMSKRYPIKLARACALFVVLLGILVPCTSIHIGVDGPTTIDIIIAAIGLALVFIGMMLLFVLPKYHKLLIAVMSALSVLSLLSLIFYWYMIRLGGSNVYIDLEVVTSVMKFIAPPVICLGLFIWLAVATHNATDGRKHHI